MVPVIKLELCVLVRLDDFFINFSDNGIGGKLQLFEQLLKGRALGYVLFVAIADNMHSLCCYYPFILE